LCGDSDGLLFGPCAVDNFENSKKDGQEAKKYFVKNYKIYFCKGSRSHRAENLKIVYKQVI
jgi:hypothetical protein